ncbi:serine/arginine repetitive matrix protein 1-like [Zea mays]|uniref:serine/arginine repetitive matrix protein 1-like n=1 Tax=Zea mays TaxID=4577 RepID=UPI0016527FC6|nr:serine/arginine repetitive matrix protein 1-like [Zea mays]
MGCRYQKTLEYRHMIVEPPSNDEDLSLGAIDLGAELGFCHSPSFSFSILSLTHRHRRARTAARAARFHRCCIRRRSSTRGQAPPSAPSRSPPSVQSRRRRSPPPRRRGPPPRGQEAAELAPPPPGLLLPAAELLLHLPRPARAPKNLRPKPLPRGRAPPPALYPPVRQTVVVSHVTPSQGLHKDRSGNGAVSYFHPQDE